MTLFTEFENEIYSKNAQCENNAPHTNPLEPNHCRIRKIVIKAKNPSDILQLSDLKQLQLKACPCQRDQDTTTPIEVSEPTISFLETSETTPSLPPGDCDYEVNGDTFDRTSFKALRNGNFFKFNFNC